MTPQVIKKHYYALLVLVVFPINSIILATDTNENEKQFFNFFQDIENAHANNPDDLPLHLEGIYPLSTCKDVTITFLKPKYSVYYKHNAIVKNDSLEQSIMLKAKSSELVYYVLKRLEKKIPFFNAAACELSSIPDRGPLGHVNLVEKESSSKFQYVDDFDTVNTKYLLKAGGDLDSLDQVTIVLLDSNGKKLISTMTKTYEWTTLMEIICAALYEYGLSKLNSSCFTISNRNIIFLDEVTEEERLNTPVVLDDKLQKKLKDNNFKKEVIYKLPIKVPSAWYYFFLGTKSRRFKTALSIILSLLAGTIWIIYRWLLPSALPKKQLGYKG